MSNYEDRSSSPTPPTKASLRKWWKLFTAKTNNNSNTNYPSTSGGGGGAVTRARASTAPPKASSSSSAYQPPGRGLAKGKSGEGRVFGVSPEQSLKYAAVAISTAGIDGKPYVYGYVPIVVAKCGMMLKETATATEGIFRVSGSNKRINQLQTLFDEPPRYGKDLDWSGYTVHDAASVLRRYLNMMPEPVIPANLYVDFVHVLQRGLPEEACVAEYQRLISLLPPTSRYLLLYLLDFLSVFVRQSHLNLMTASNLAVVFQPGLVSTRREGSGEGALLGFPGFVDGRIPPPSARGAGAQAREGAGEHGRGKEVLEFLIEQQSKFMIGLEVPPASTTSAMQGISASTTGREASPIVGGPRTSSKGKEREDAATSAMAMTGEVALNRRGSEKSVERRRLRKAADGSNGKVKRSRTLPGRGSSMAAANPPILVNETSSTTPPTKDATADQVGNVGVGSVEMRKARSGGSSSQENPRHHKTPTASSTNTNTNTLAATTTRNVASQQPDSSSPASNSSSSSPSLPTTTSTTATSITTATSHPASSTTTKDRINQQTTLGFSNDPPSSSTLSSGIQPRKSSITPSTKSESGRLKTTLAEESGGENRRSFDTMHTAHSGFTNQDPDSTNAGPPLASQQSKERSVSSSSSRTHPSSTAAAASQGGGGGAQQVLPRWIPGDHPVPHPTTTTR